MLNFLLSDVAHATVRIMNVKEIMFQNKKFGIS